MIELLLGMIILGSTLAFVFQWQARNITISRARIDAETLVSFQKIAQQYITVNRDAIVQATQDGIDANKHCVINATGYDPVTGILTGTMANDTALHTCAFDATLLAKKGLWPLAVPQAADDRWVAIVRQVYDNAAPPNPTGDLEVLFVKAKGSGTPVVTPWDKDKDAALAANEAARMLGGTGGVVPVGKMPVCEATKTNVQACGNGWKVDLSKFISNSQLTTLKNALP